MSRHQLKKFTLIELLIALTIASMLFAAMAHGMFILLSIESNQTSTNANNESINYLNLKIANEIRNSTSQVINKNKMMLTQPDNIHITYSFSGKDGDPLEYQIKNEKSYLIENIKDFNFQEINGYIQYELILNGPDNTTISVKNSIKPRTDSKKNSILVSWTKL